LLEVVLENYFSNAWKYSSKKERRVIEFGAYEKAGEQVVFVKDNGAGFSMEYANKLFVLFQRLHDASQFEGSGVGLASVSRIIQRHGGRVWAEGGVGEGACFYFSLPMHVG
jgi:light-regulated signal transduction histidine kinase (bacteriophytochrome)